MQDHSISTKEADNVRTIRTYSHSYRFPAVESGCDKNNGYWIGPLGLAMVASMLGAVLAVAVGISFWIVLILLPTAGSGLFLCLTVLNATVRNRREQMEPGREGGGFSHFLGKDEDPSFTTWSQRQRGKIATEQESDLVFCVGSDGSYETRNIAELLFNSDFTVHICNDLDVVLETIAEAPYQWRAIVIDLDYIENYQSLGEIIDDMQQFRLRAPEVLVLMVSGEFQRHDFSLERLVISDACLKAPVSEKALLDGLLSAMQNNSVWQIRQMNAKKSRGMLN